jgi:glycosyltransferase involved in cell wall biosynthesis
VLAYWGNYAGTCAWAFHQHIGRQIPFSIWVHAGTDLYRNTAHLRTKLLYADNIITCCEFNTEYLATEFSDIHAQIRDRVHICHHGLDLAQYPFLPGQRVPRRIVAVGRLSAYKGFEYLLRATALARRAGEEVTLDLVGGGELHGALTREAADLGISAHVHFRGWVQHAEARRAIREATLLVHPSDGIGDGLPNVVREAMALGTPVVASAVAGIPDALADERGVLVPPRDPVQLFNAIRLLLHDPARRLRIAQRARQRVEQQYDLWQNGRRLASLLTSTRRGRAPLMHPSRLAAAHATDRPA